MTDKFKPLFGMYDFLTSANVDFGRNPFDLFATGYKMAADKLTDHALDEVKNAEKFVYPIVFLYRHYLELRLKEIVRQGKDLLQEAGDFRKDGNGHNLAALWEDAKTIMLKIEGHPADEFEFCEYVVKSFSDDPKGAEFRYPENKKGKATLAGVKAIDLNHVKESLGKVSEFLDRVSGMIASYKDSQLDGMDRP